MSAWACDCGRSFDKIRSYRLHVRRCQNLPSAIRQTRPREASQQSGQDGLSRPVIPCVTRTPEPHERGEFPMSCYECHVWADS